MSRKAQLYRHFDSDGVLLYVGISCNVLRRTSEHRSSDWFYDICNITIEHFENRQYAKRAEADAIIAEKPKYNVNINWMANKQIAFENIQAPISLKEYTAICGSGLLAKNVGISHSFISQIANGYRNPSPKIAKRIYKETDHMVSLENLRPDLWGNDILGDAA